MVTHRRIFEWNEGLVHENNPSQFGPRLLRNFIRSNTTQLTLGILLATHTYCLVVMRNVRVGEETFVPHIATFGAFLLSLLSLALFIAFIHHVVSSIQAERVVAVITFEQTGRIVPVPLVYFALTAIEGNLVTPWIIGKRFTINPIIVFVWVLCWGAMWGIPGMLIGLPLLMVFRIVCAKLPGLSRVERVISI